MVLSSVTISHSKKDVDNIVMQTNPEFPLWPARENDTIVLLEKRTEWIP